MLLQILSSTIKMNTNEPQTDQPSALQLLDLRFTAANFMLLEKTARPENLTPVMQIFTDQLIDLGFIYSHEILIEQCIGKALDQYARMLVFLNANQSGYALLTDLYHVKSWVYFTHYFDEYRRVITTCQPGALHLEQMREQSSTSNFLLQNTGSSTLAAQWKKHNHTIASKFPTEKALLLDLHQQVNAEQEAYRMYTDLLLDCVVLRQSDTQLVGLTHTGADSYYSAVTSKSARRPKPKIEEWIGKRKRAIKPSLNYRNAALTASAAVFGLLVYNIANYESDNTTINPDYNQSTQSPASSLPRELPIPEEQEPAIAITPATNTVSITDSLPELRRSTDSAATSTDTKPEQFVVASEEDEMWRIAVENAEFYLMSNDGDPTPWIRTARKMAAGFKGDDPRLARTYFLAALLERDPKIAEQQYNRALSIQTKSIGLYHAETAQTLEALAWVAEGSRDALEDAITHQRLALNVYRSIFGEDAEDTRAARWKLQYFQDRLAGRRPKSDENRRLLPSLARFAR